MRSVFLAVLAAFFAEGLPAQAPSPTPTPAPLQRSLSASKQFVVYYSEGTVRAKVARKLEDVKGRWLQTLGLQDEWKSPIVVQLNSLAPPGAPSLRTRLFLSDGGEKKIQIDVNDLGVLRGGEFDREIYRALLLEFMYREHTPKEGKSYQQPPVWLLEGFLEDARSRDGEGIAAGLYDRIVESGPPPKLEAFLKEKPELMDATTRAIYRARSMALLRALLALPEGSSGLVKWISSLPEGKAAETSQLEKCFPDLEKNPTRLSKQWALSLADASAKDRAKALTMAETSRALDEIMNFGAPTDPKKPNENLVSGPKAFPLVARSKAGRFIMAQKAEDLLRLQIRSHPLLRSVIGEYHLIAAELVHKPKKNMDKRLTEALELQKAITARSREIEDFMNWFDAAKMETPSEEFDVILEMPTDDSQGRADPITRFLNDLEARGW